VLFGDGERGARRDPASGRLCVGPVGDAAEAIVHDAHDPDPSQAFALARLTDTAGLSLAPVGIFRSVEAPVFDDEARAQVRMPAASERLARLQERVTGADTWTV
jgi:2-oxoglutarate ferredoxin oxidoreductase subunit beta